MKINNSLCVHGLEESPRIAGILLIIMASIAITITGFLALFLSGYLNNDSFMYDLLVQHYQQYIEIKNPIIKNTLKPILLFTLLLQVIFHSFFFHNGIKLINREKISILWIFFAVAVQFVIFTLLKSFFISFMQPNSQQTLFIEIIHCTFISLYPYNVYYLLPITLCFITLGKIVHDNFYQTPKTITPTRKSRPLNPNKIQPRAIREVKAKNAIRTDCIEWRRPELSK